MTEHDRVQSTADREQQRLSDVEEFFMFDEPLQSAKKMLRMEIVGQCDISLCGNAFILIHQSSQLRSAARNSFVAWRSPAFSAINIPFR